jgi:hypothetical protein
VGLGETTLRSWCQIGNTQTLICTNPQTPKPPNPQTPCSSFAPMYQPRQNDKGASRCCTRSARFPQRSLPR